MNEDAVYKVILVQFCVFRLKVVVSHVRRLDDIFQTRRYRQSGAENICTVAVKTVGGCKDNGSEDRHFFQVCVGGEGCLHGIQAALSPCSHPAVKSYEAYAATFNSFPLTSFCLQITQRDLVKTWVDLYRAFTTAAALNEDTG